MPALPEAFTQPEFPEISATEEFGAATLVFFDHFDFPTAEQPTIADQLDGYPSSAGAAGTTPST